MVAVATFDTFSRSCNNQQRLSITQRKSSLVALSRINQRHTTCRRSCRMSQIADTNVSWQANLPKTNNRWHSYLDNSRRIHRIAMKPKLTQSCCALELLESHYWFSKKQIRLFFATYFYILLFSLLFIWWLIWLKEHEFTKESHFIVH